ncbi:hypothetical protein K0038_00939 [Pseudomonas syringae]|nr:hypothetical protein [Pseudomonas syringae]
MSINHKHTLLAHPGSRSKTRSFPFSSPMSLHMGIWIC